MSAVIGILVVFGFIAVSIVSSIYGGEGGLIIGIIGILLFVLALVGFILSYKALKQRDIFHRFPMIGTISNGIMIIILITMYILGMYL